MKYIGKGVLLGIIFAASLFLVSHLLQYIDYRRDIRRLDQDLISTEQRYSRKTESWVSYVERRINSVAKQQDEQQVILSKKISQLADKNEKLEKRLESLENTIKEEKQNKK